MKNCTIGFDSDGSVPDIPPDGLLNPGGQRRVCKAGPNTRAAPERSLPRFRYDLWSTSHELVDLVNRSRLGLSEKPKEATAIKIDPLQRRPCAPIRHGFRVNPFMRPPSRKRSYMYRCSREIESASRCAPYEYFSVSHVTKSLSRIMQGCSTLSIPWIIPITKIA